MLDKMPDGDLQLHVLAVLPTALPGKGHMTIARHIQRRTDVKWTHAELRFALADLMRRGLVKRHERVEQGEYFEVYTRDPSYVAPLDVGVPLGG